MKAVQRQKVQQQQQTEKKEISGTTSPPISKEDVDKQSYLASLQEKIQLSVSKFSLKSSKKDSDRFIPPPLILDDKGREIDSKGNVISKLSRDSITTLKANRKFKVHAKMAELFIPGEKKKKYFIF